MMNSKITLRVTYIDIPHPILHINTDKRVSSPCCVDSWHCCSLAQPKLSSQFIIYFNFVRIRNHRRVILTDTLHVRLIVGRSFCAGRVEFNHGGPLTSVIRYQQEDADAAAFWLVNNVTGSNGRSLSRGQCIYRHGMFIFFPQSLDACMDGQRVGTN